MCQNGEIQFTEKDLEQLKKHGSSREKIGAQLEIFKRGIPFADLDRAALVTDGIKSISSAEYDELNGCFAAACHQGRITKFVPASGAATRMFKNLLYFFHKYDTISLKDLKSCTEEDEGELQEFITTLSGLEQFAFYDDLHDVLAMDGYELAELIRVDDYKTILSYLLTEKGLNYADNPKAFLTFHRYAASCRNSFEEHIIEGIEYSRDQRGKIRLHFTLSEKFIRKDYLENLFSPYCADGKNEFIVSYSIQKAETDTIAVDEQNKPFRDKEGKLVLRPAGHGALIENLNDLDGDIIFIKNIDNVVPDSLKEETYKYKKLLAGCLVKLQDKIFHYIKILKTGGEESISEIMAFMTEELAISFAAGFDDLPLGQRTDFMMEKLNRPIRICGMVKNGGETGGGPFWVRNKKGELSLQVVETAQIDKENDSQLKILHSSSHFNPVDLVCGIKDYQGHKFNLKEFIDDDAAFISRKSSNGRALKALELPGLWNGAMADWITIFVEVPLITFNPVKSVNDLLRKEHQG